MYVVLKVQTFIFLLSSVGRANGTGGKAKGLQHLCSNLGGTFKALDLFKSFIFKKFRCKIDLA